jgi:intein/homing endonuclease
MSVLSPFINKTFVLITFSDGIVNINTPEHPYLVKEKGWCCADPSVFSLHPNLHEKRLEAGYLCYTLIKGQILPIAIKAIAVATDRTEPTYNLEIEGTNCYFANGILVHNKP